jgi:hypothetical protein
MVKIVQIAGGSAEVEDLYIGPPRELRADESNDELRLHDGSKRGGWRIPNRDANDVRYQVKNPELDGLSFGPQLKGFVVRTAPGQYRIRAITVNDENLSLTNGAGTAGNVLLALAPTITTNHTFSGIATFTQGIVASGGVIGNVTGNLIGNVTGNLTGNVTGDITGDLLGNTFGVHTGGLDTRGATVEMDDKQIQLAWLADAIIDLITTRGVPAGTIMIWSGIVADIPDGYKLCNGLDGTPDLRDKFVIGAGGTLNPGDTGGANSLSPTITVPAAGSHNHTLPAISGSAVTGITPVVNLQTTYAGGGTQHGVHDFTLNDPGHTHSGGGNTGDAGSHTHAATVTFDNRPSYYAFCYIIKVV